MLVTVIPYCTCWPVPGAAGVWVLTTRVLTVAGWMVNTVHVNSPAPEQIPMPSMYAVFPTIVGAHTAAAIALYWMNAPAPTGMVSPVMFAVRTVADGLM